MLKKELASALGISGAMVSKLAKRGMPTDTLERAQRWRKRHLEPSRVKGQRMGTAAPANAVVVAPMQRRPLTASDVESAALEVMDFLTMCPGEAERAESVKLLRAMLRQLPSGEKPRFPLGVWLCLTEYCLNDEASVRQHPEGGLCVDSLAFSKLVSPAAPVLDWLNIACDWGGFSVTGWSAESEEEED